MCVTSRKAWNYDKAVKRELVAGIIFFELPNTKKWRLTKYETSLRVTLRQSYLTFEAQELHTASW